MKIRVLGFSWKYTNNNFDELRRVLDEESTRRMGLLKKALDTGNMSGWDGTIFTISNHNGCWVGVVLKVRDQSRFCQVSSTGGKVTLTAQDLASDSKMVEVNFFLLNPKTGKGIYQYYHQSTWVARFNHTCRYVVSAWVQKEQEKIARICAEKGLSTKDSQKAQQVADRDLASELIIKKEQFQELINELKQVKKVTIRDESLGRGDMGAISDSANRIAMSFTYTKQTRFSDLRSSIVKFAKDRAPWRMRVEGILSDGSEEIVNLISNKDYFDECEFDDVSKGMEVDLLDPNALIAGSQMGQKIISTARKPRVAKMLGLLP